MTGWLAAPFIVLLFWIWAVLGYRRLALSPEGPLHRRRAALATGALGALFIVALAAELAPDFPTALAATLGALAVALHGLFEPTGASFWRHRRLRPLATLALAALTAAVATFKIRPEVAVLVYAALTLHHHLAMGARLQAETSAETQALRLKILSLSAEAKLPSGRGAASPVPVTLTATAEGGEERETSGDKGQSAG